MGCTACLVQTSLWLPGPVSDAWEIQKQAEHGVADCDSGVPWVRGDVFEVNSLQQISSYVNLPNHVSAYVDFWLPPQHEAESFTLCMKNDFLLLILTLIT